MFPKETYINRRNKLRTMLNDEAILFMGHPEVPRTYDDNTYHFRQNSHFLYFAGHALPQMALLMLPDRDILFGHQLTMDDMIWTGPLPSLIELGQQVGIEQTKPIEALKETICALGNAKKLHYLRPFQGDHALTLGRILDKNNQQLLLDVSTELQEAVTKLRLYKSAEEIQEIEQALETTFDMYQAAAQTMQPGLKEWDVMSAMVTTAFKKGCEQAFHPIITKRGEVLHNHSYNNILMEGDLLLLDSGAENASGYSSDITRTFPVSGEFTGQQKEIYDIVLSAQQTAIDAAKPGITNKELHIKAATVITQGLIDTGLMKGNAESAVKEGAHALFFPHGLGHMMGLDVHDMEDLGDIVGYGPGKKRSEQFGLSALRMARTLEPGFVFTIEPGIYFIPPLIKKWAQESKHTDFINYDRVESYLDFGGIRIEDDILVKENEAAVLGKGIPKEVSELEKFIKEAKQTQ